MAIGSHVGTCCVNMQILLDKWAKQLCSFGTGCNSSCRNSSQCDQKNYFLTLVLHCFLCDFIISHKLKSDVNFFLKRTLAESLNNKTRTD